jgi:hypothetical protein
MADTMDTEVSMVGMATEDMAGTEEDLTEEVITEDIIQGTVILITVDTTVAHELESAMEATVVDTEVVGIKKPFRNYRNY